MANEQDREPDQAPPSVLKTAGQDVAKVAVSIPLPAQPLRPTEEIDRVRLLDPRKTATQQVSAARPTGPRNPDKLRLHEPPPVMTSENVIDPGIIFEWGREFDRLAAEKKAAKAKAETEAPANAHATATGPADKAASHLEPPPSVRPALVPALPAEAPRAGATLPEPAPRVGAPMPAKANPSRFQRTLGGNTERLVPVAQQSRQAEPPSSVDVVVAPPAPPARMLARSANPSASPWAKTAPASLASSDLPSCHLPPADTDRPSSDRSTQPIRIAHPAPSRVPIIVAIVGLVCVAFATIAVLGNTGPRGAEIQSGPATSQTVLPVQAESTNEGAALAHPTTLPTASAAAPLEATTASPGPAKSAFRQPQKVTPRSTGDDPYEGVVPVAPMLAPGHVEPVSPPTVVLVPRAVPRPQAPASKPSDVY